MSERNLGEEKGQFLMRRGEDENRQMELAVAEALHSLEAARGDRASYFDLVPEQYRSTVRQLAETNHQHFKTQFPSFDDFLSEISRNWLAKVRVFESLVKAKGFQEIDPANVDEERLDRSAIACLTRSASYVLVGPGAYNAKGEGAAMRYTKIPFRPTGVPDVSKEKGFLLYQIPQRGKQLDIGDAMTSPLISAYYREMEGKYEIEGNHPEMLAGIDSSIQHSFINVDHKTVGLKEIIPKE